MLEKMRKIAAGMGTLARAYMPAGLETVLLEMAQKIDALEQKVDSLTKDETK